MDALDESHQDNPDKEEDDGGEENVDADEREGNIELSERLDQNNSNRDQNQDYEEDDSNDHQNLHIEKKMKSLNLNNDNDQEKYDSIRAPHIQNMIGNPYIMRDNSQDTTDPNMTPGRFSNQHDMYNESYQNYEDYCTMSQNQFEGGDVQQNNRLIMQYESVLQSINREFQKLLDKNKQTEEDLSITKMKLEQVQNAYEQEANRNFQNEGKSSFLSSSRSFR
jgi:hypothetical protein